MHRGNCAWRAGRCARTVLSVSCLLALSVCSAAAWSQPSDAEDAGPLHTYPVTSDTIYVVSNNTGGVAGTGERLIYDNPLGAAAVELPANVRIADDLTLAVQSGCRLHRYRVRVIGKANPTGCGGLGVSCGPVTIDLDLYDECPDAGGQPIPGTHGCVSNDPARTDCLPLVSEFDPTDVEIVVPDGDVVTLPSTVWLAVQTSRANAGVVVGAPALLGFSGDVLSTIDFPCNSWLGGLPSQPFAGFNASVWGDADCADAFLTYQDIRASQPGINAGANNCIGDDIVVQRPCRMVEMSVGVRGAGVYDFELRPADLQSGANPPPPVGDCFGGQDSMNQNAIPGTYQRFLNPEAGLLVKHFVFDPPVELPADPFYAVMVPNNINATWILTGRDAEIGSTSERYLKWDGSDWALVLPPSVHGGMQLSITCEGTPPIGACCDMLLADQTGTNECREVPEMNCSSFFVGENFEPAWVEGASCADDPFPHACGAAACCEPDDSCENITEAECDAVLPLNRPRIWNVGYYCEDADCPFNACLQGSGDCQIPHDNPGCVEPSCCSDVCDVDNWCCSVQWDDLCQRHAEKLCQEPPPNDDCYSPFIGKGARKLIVDAPPITTDLSLASTSSGDGFCCDGGVSYCQGGCLENYLPRPCHVDADCTGSADGFCDFYEGAPSGQCAGGCRDGELCYPPYCSAGINYARSCKPRCNGGERDGEPCGSLADCPGASSCDGTIDCPGGKCVSGPCSGAEDGTCPAPVPAPGEHGYGSVWYRFTVPDDGTHNPVSIEVSTCASLPPASDSLMQVYAIADPDRGLCNGYGECRDGTPCDHIGGACDDGSVCATQERRCSVAAQDCPLAETCALDREAACQSLSVIGCNDDAADACGGEGSPHNSTVCLSDLTPGETYYVLIAAKLQEDLGRYSISATTVSSCQGTPQPANDFCMEASELRAGAGRTVFQFDLDDATPDCRVPRCNQAMQDDIWYTWTAPADGTLTIDTCGDGVHPAPDTEMMVYFGCTCPPTEAPIAPLCLSSSDDVSCPDSAATSDPIEVTGGECLMLRVADNGGAGGSGTLTVTFTPDVPDTDCDTGDITAIDPPNGVIDAGWDLNCANPKVLLGLKKFEVAGPPGNASPACWSLCDSAPNATSNAIKRVTEGPTGVYTIELVRAITPGQCSSIIYNAVGSLPASQTYMSLPGDVDGNGVVNATDILELIDALNQVVDAPWGERSTDVDRSGATNATDVLAVIDLLNGVGFCRTWNNVALPPGCGKCPEP